MLTLTVINDILKYMKQNLHWIIVCIDKSGSMAKIKDDMIGGFNSFIQSQLKLNIGECRIFAYSFDTYYETLFDNVDIKTCPQLNYQNYIPRGWTALYDSLGKTITDIGEKLRNLEEIERPEKVLVVTITDGEDNSRLLKDGVPFSSDEVKKMVEHQKNVYKWDFAYIGANQDAWAVGGSIGVAQASSLNYIADSHGTAVAFDKLSTSTTHYRATKSATFAFTDKSSK